MAAVAVEGVAALVVVNLAAVVVVVATVADLDAAGGAGMVMVAEGWKGAGAGAMVAAEVALLDAVAEASVRAVPLAAAELVAGEVGSLAVVEKD
jgi:hypothetical protein